MSSNSFTWVTEGGDLSTADWGCLAGRCANLCLQAACGGRAASAALFSDKKHIRGVYARCAIQIDTFTFFYLIMSSSLA